MPKSVRLDFIHQAKMLRDSGWSQRRIAERLNVAQPTVCAWLKKLDDPRTLQERTAYKIRAELVCCNIYQRMEDAYNPEDDSAWEALRRSREYHDICFFGEWAARLAEGMK